ncbi:zinc-containing alcohol [Moniliophthora roreri]|nr:zinc-containing alcohol [Moniliophthora roreri]
MVKEWEGGNDKGTGGNNKGTEFGHDVQLAGSDHHVVNGDLGEIARFPVRRLGTDHRSVLQPTIHEVVGCVVKTGKNVQDLFEGDRCVADPITRCHKCFFCRRGQQSNKLHKIFNVSDEEATLIEPLFCAVHTVDKIASAVVPMSLSSALALVMDVAKQVNAADKYLELNRHNLEEQWKKFKEDNPFGFNVVVEASGSARLLVDSVRLVRRGGTLALRHLWRSLGIMACHPNLCQRNSHTFPRAIAYMDSGKINVKGMVRSYDTPICTLLNFIQISHIYTHSGFQRVLEALNDRQFMKVIVKPGAVAQ